MNPSMEIYDHLIAENIKKSYCNIQLENTGTFSVMSYNVLSSSYAAPRMYPYCPKEYLDWETRGQSIINEINDYECDVICLQEVEMEAFLEFFSPKLETKGYIGIFAPKSRARTMSDTKRRLVDGCAIFWKTEKFTLVSQELIEFNQLAIKNNAGCQDMLNRVMIRDNIGLFAVLKTTAAAWQDGKFLRFFKFVAFTINSLSL
ncbi:CCR4-NOT transcription complex subunit 6-like [Microplitis mediator]|uniref:CCR4-NOT transcription complex subunit 6-like n=1 Tax=Microplitis mediator TaxID=375433 RepID=UPI0025520E74|nr:CCR4-NOT transcription complex subunit 6-like [Microplitis mediator]